MINLTKKAADHFKQPFPQLDKRTGNYWLIDIVFIKGKKYYLCSHEQTLFTRIIHTSLSKKIPDLSILLFKTLPIDYGEPSIGRSDNRRVLGSMTDMKVTIKYMKEEHEIAHMERLINRTPFLYLGGKNPNMRVTELIRES